MSLRKSILGATLLAFLAVTGVAQSAPDSPTASPAHPFLGLDVVPTAPVDPVQQAPDPQMVPNGPATAPTAPAAAPTPAPIQIAPAATPTPSASPAPQVKPSGHPVAVPKAPSAPLQIITDPRMIQQLFGRDQGAPMTPTPEMLEAVFNRVWQQVAQSYHDPARLTDWYKFQDKYKGKLLTEEDLEKALKEMLASLRDPWTKYITTAEINAARADAEAGVSSLGIWIVRNPDGSYHVDYTTYGTTSYRSGLHKHDELISANGKPFNGLPQEAAEALLKGKDGSTIEVVYRRNGKEYSEKLTVTPAAETGVVARLIPGNIAYVRLPQFDPQSFGMFVQALQQLHAQSGGNLNGLIFDLRGNPGGMVDLALKTASIFMEKGTIVNSTTREGRMVTHQGYEVIAPLPHDFIGAPQEIVTMITDFYKVPMVVLIDGSSASSSEIVTGALKDSGRATILGTTTYGKGVGYNTGSIPPGGTLYVTTMDYLTPSGYNLSNKGIPPQIVVERTPGAKGDEQLEAAIKLLKANNPDPLTIDPDQDKGKKQFGEGDWTSNPLAIAAGCALFLLLIVFAAFNHVYANRRRKEEAKRDGESE